jgi:hypothetical protein
VQRGVGRASSEVSAGGAGGPMCLADGSVVTV